MRGELSDPNSIAAISRRAQIQQAQSVTDSEFDPPIPPPRKVSGFEDGPNENLRDLTHWLCFFSAMLMLLIICWIAAGEGSWKKMLGILKTFKITRLFRGK